MRTPSALVSLSIVMASTTASHAGFTGFTRERVITAAGNTQYSVYANFDSVGLPSGKSWVFLNAYNYQGCLLYTSPSPRDRQKSRMPSSA